MGCRSNRRVKSSSGCRSSWQPGLVSAWTDAALHEIPSGQHHGRCSTALAARDYKPTHTHDAKQLLVKMASRVENRRSNCSLPVDNSTWLSPRHLSPVWLGPVSCPRSSNRTSRFPASGSRKRLTLSPTEGSRSGVVTGPGHTRSEETLPENACMPAAARCVCRITTDAASGGRGYRPHCRPC